MNVVSKFIVLLLVIAGLYGCGTDTSKSTETTEPVTTNPVVVDPANPDPDPDVTIITTTTEPIEEDRQASISLRLTDAPLDDVVKVVVQFTGVQLIHETEGKSTSFNFETPQTIDLLLLQGSNTAVLLNEVPIEAGDYSEIRLFTNAEDLASFIETDDGGIHELKIPSGNSSGLKLKGDVIVTAQRDTGYVIDFDLLRSVKKAGNSGKYILSPVLRLINDADAGTITGSVDPTLLVDPSCSDDDVDSHNSLYVFDGHDQIPTDINEDNSEKLTPVTTSIVNYDGEQEMYLYEAAFLPAGDYTIAVTCNADQEDLETDDDLQFFDIQNVTVLINNTIFL